ncbi:MAG: hypothetical protein PHI11_01645 [Gallionella sp.]|nr:hypothetical protein [Gallionella sp.]
MSFVSTNNTVPTGGVYNLGGVNYAAAGTALQGDMTFNSLSPYIGIGWGNPVAKDKGWGFVADLGLLYQGNPKASLTATGGTAAFQVAVVAEQTQFQAALNAFTWHPVAMLGLSYQW